MKTFKISAMPTDRLAAFQAKRAEHPHYPADYADCFKAGDETTARALWTEENNRFCGGRLSIVGVEEISA